MNKTQELPKWFTNSGGITYKKGGVCTNNLSGEGIELTNVELSLYDYIKGAELIAYQTNDKEIISNFNKALGWFKKANPEAYMVLLD